MLILGGIIKEVNNMKASNEIVFWGFAPLIVLVITYIFFPDNGLITLIGIILFFLLIPNIFLQVYRINKKKPKELKQAQIQNRIKSYDWTLKIDFMPHIWKIKKVVFLIIPIIVVLSAIIYFVVPEEFNMNESLIRGIWLLILCYVFYSLFPGGNK